jgi:hypothetical protein
MKLPPDAVFLGGVIFSFRSDCRVLYVDATASAVRGLAGQCGWILGTLFPAAQSEVFHDQESEKIEIPCLEERCSGLDKPKSASIYGMLFSTASRSRLAEVRVCSGRKRDVLDLEHPRRRLRDLIFSERSLKAACAPFWIWDFRLLRSDAVVSLLTPPAAIVIFESSDYPTGIFHDPEGKIP